jgi:UPF0755 protein
MTHHSGPVPRAARRRARHADPPGDEADTNVLPRMSDELLAELDEQAVPDATADGPLDAHSARSKRLSEKRIARRRTRRRRARRATAILATSLFGCGAVAFAVMKLTHWQGPGKDFSGPAGLAVVIQVRPGDTSQQIAETMMTKGVVASTSAFYKAAVHDDAMSSLQPGYYQVPTHVSGATAVSDLLGKDARVGNLVLSDGRQLFDSHDAHTGALKEGIYRKIAEASCYGSGAARHCVGYDDLAAAGASPDLAALGVPDWAADAVRRVPDHTRQLEGLIASGTWDFDPTASPVQILRQLVTESAASYVSTGLLQAGAATHSTPYQMLIAASLVEREALPQDMAKVARVIFNRLAVNQPLQFDSTVNYDLANTAVATTDADRERVTPWNTYAKSGLPATPISSPSLAALKAVENPTPGPWLYFVTIDKRGTTLFTADYAEHLKNIKLAEESGILDGATPCPQSGCPR